jgi:Putative peptidoglycan binding domain
MLPHFKTSIKTAAITVVTALTLAVTSAAPAAAWGQREQDVLKGAAGALILKAIIDDAQRDRRAQPIYREAPEPTRYGHGHPPKQPPRQYHDDRQTSVYNTAAARAFNSYSKSERRLIQRRLAQWGYYRGGVDGSFGPGTYSAVAAYARDNGQGRSLASTAGAFGVYDGLIY